MITIIAATNRKGSNTLKVAREYQQILEEKGILTTLFSLEDIDTDAWSDFEQVENDILVPSTHFVVICPEYNGSFPGVFKMMIDKCRIPPVWHNKKVMLTGVASGRAGNLRGLDHLTNVFNHMKVTVFPNKLPISVVNTVVNSDEKITDPNTLKAIHQQVDDFILWGQLEPLPIKN